MSGRVDTAALREQATKRVRGPLPFGGWGPRCVGCNADEYRVDGYCSVACRDYHDDDLARDVLALLDECDRLRAAMRHVIDASPGTPDSVKKYLVRELEGSWGEPYEERMTRPEYERATLDEALDDARDYLAAGLENQAEWWEHLGDAHRDYAALARLAVAQSRELDEQEGYPGIAHDFEQAKRRAEAAEALAARYEQAFRDLEDVARAALTWGPGNAKIELANRLGAALAAGSGEERDE